MPVLQITGTSMEPTLVDGQLVVTVKTTEFEPGDITAFYFNNKILVKRVIASPCDWVEIDHDGNVYVNNILLEEPYLTERALGECNIEMPYQVPEGRIFVMGDHRAVSVDSRSQTVGCVAEEQVVGKLVFRLWPLDQFGKLN
jgi:signal peptidase I